MKAINILAAILMWVASSAMVSAAILTVDVGGQLTGASGVDVDGTDYDVAFLDSTCIALFDNCDAVSDFDFQTETQADAATEALFEQVFIDGPLGAFGTMPSLINGLEDSSSDIFFVITPYGFMLSGNLTCSSAGLNSLGLPGFVQGPVCVSPADDLASNDRLVFAVWTPSRISPIPVPTSGVLWLSVLGLGAGAVLGRRKQVLESNK